MNLFFKRDEEVRVLDMEFARSSEWVGHVHVCNNNSFSLIKTLDLPSIESRGERVSADGLGDLPVPPSLNFHPSIPGSRPWAHVVPGLGAEADFENDVICWVSSDNWDVDLGSSLVSPEDQGTDEEERVQWRPLENLHFILLTTSFPRQPWKSKLKNSVVHPTVLRERGFPESHKPSNRAT